MIRMMKHALNIFDEDDPHRPQLKGWPSRLETNPSLWREYPEEYVLFLDVPGIPRKELHLNTTKHHLLVTGQHGACLRPAKTAVGEERFCVERAVMERIRIPDDVNPEHLQAKFKDGVLIVKMPKVLMEGKSIPIHDYVPSWSEKAKEAKDAVLDKIGVHHEGGVY